MAVGVLVGVFVNVDVRVAVGVGVRVPVAVREGVGVRLACWSVFVAVGPAA